MHDQMEKGVPAGKAMLTAMKNHEAGKHGKHDENDDGDEGEEAK